MKRFCLLLLLPVTSQAATYAGTENIGQVIPDNNLSGLTSSVAVSGDSTSITSVQVVLNLSNAVAGWSGDTLKAMACVVETEKFVMAGEKPSTGRTRL